MLSDEDVTNEKNWDENIFEIDNNERPERLFIYINSLPEKYKDVIILKFIEGFSYDEISDVLKIPPGTVAVRINRAKSRLKQLLRTSKDSK
jgi:RNA polymerase sigma factor (sigma-70 family)